MNLKYVRVPKVGLAWRKQCCLNSENPIRNCIAVGLTFRVLMGTLSPTAHPQPSKFKAETRLGGLSVGGGEDGKCASRLRGGCLNGLRGWSYCMGPAVKCSDDSSSHHMGCYAWLLGYHLGWCVLSGRCLHGSCAKLSVPLRNWLVHRLRLGHRCSMLQWYCSLRALT